MKGHFPRAVGLLAVLSSFVLVVGTPTALSAQLLKRLCPCVPCPAAPQPAPSVQPETSGGTGANAGAASQEAAPSPPNMPPENLLAQAGAGAASGPMSAAPNMIGDFFGGSTSQSAVVRHFTIGNLWTPDYNFSGSGSSYQTFALSDTAATNPVTSGGPWTVTGATNQFQGTFHGPVTGYGPGAGIPSGGRVVDGTTTGTVPLFSEGNFGQNLTSSFDVAYQFNVPNPGSGGVVGRTKIGEDSSPLPRDRILFDYSFFEGVPLSPGGVNVHRFTPGFEKTFLDGAMSFEMKVPVAVTMDSTSVQDSGADLSHGEFGDLAMTIKAMLASWDHLAISGGLMVAVPTARDTNVVLADGTPLVRIANHSTHLAPFVGFLWTPNDRFFVQGFYQVDVEAGGCPVSVNLNQTGLQEVGTLHDTTYQYIDLGFGSWLYRGHDRYRNLTGWAWTAELHGNDSFAPNAPVVANNWQIGDSNSFDAWDLTLGTHLEFKDRSVLTLAYVDPLGGNGRQFNGEFRLMFNYFFGSSRSVSAPEM